MKIPRETGISTDMSQNMLLIVSCNITRHVAMIMLNSKFKELITISIPPQLALG